MIDKLRSIFEKFAAEYNLRWDFEYLDSTGAWALTYQNWDRSWGYRRLFSEQELNAYRGSVDELGEHVIQKVLSKMRFYKLIQENDMEVV